MDNNQSWQQGNGQPNNNWGNGYQGYQQPPRRRNKFAMASLICGIVSIAMFTSVFIPLIAGSLALIFGFLSKVEDGPMEKNAKCGSIIGGLAMGGVLIITTVTILRFFYDPTFKQQTEALFEQTMGISFEEYKTYLEESYDQESIENTGDSLYDYLMNDWTGQPKDFQ